jgi:hypothetical protein
MKSRNMLVAAILVSAAGLSAFSINASADSSVAPGKTRAEVNAELAQARADGWNPMNDEEYVRQVPFKSTKTRAQVKAELLEARQNGWTPAADDDARYTVVPPFKSTRTRAEVKAELVQARAQEAVSGHHVSSEE